MKRYWEDSFQRNKKNTSLQFYIWALNAWLPVENNLYMLHTSVYGPCHIDTIANNYSWLNWIKSKLTECEDISIESILTIMMWQSNQWHNYANNDDQWSVITLINIQVCRFQPKTNCCIKRLNEFYWVCRST